MAVCGRLMRLQRLATSCFAHPTAVQRLSVQWSNSSEGSPPLAVRGALSGDN